MSRVAVSGRGLRVLGSGLILGLIGFLFRDSLLLVLGAVVFVVLGYSYIQTRRVLVVMGGARVSEMNKMISMTAGKSFETSFTVSPVPVIAVKSKSNFMGLTYSTAVANSVLGVGLRFEPRLSGTYGVDVMGLEFAGPFGLVDGCAEVPLGLEFKVYPRVYEVALEAAALLGEGDIYSMGETPTRLIGSGYEYADTRPYDSGDSFRMIDWKASARLDRMMVRDHYHDGGAYRHVIFDAYSTDSESSDVLATSYLRLVMSLSRLGSRLGLTILRGGKAESHYSLSPGEMVVLALESSLEAVQGSFQDLYPLLDMSSRMSVKNVLERVKGLKANENRGLRDTLISGVEFEVMMGLDKESVAVELSMVSMLCADIAPVIDVASWCRLRGWVFNVLQPCVPWRTVANLDDSMRINKALERAYRVLSKSDVVLFTSVEQMASPKRRELSRVV